jgi:nitrite reductase/ring-hydroxylating ferredoxin subunit
MRILSILVLIVCLASCTATLPTYSTKITGNSIDIGVDGFQNSNINIVTDETSPRRIVLIKRSPLAFDALYLECSYDKQSLGVTSTGIACPVCHSTYDFDGGATRGPATTRLTKFPTELSADQTRIRIDIQSLGI